MTEEVTGQTSTETTPAASTEAVVVSGTETAPQAVAPAGEAPQAAGTLATTEPAERPVVAPADWPDDWRAKVAGEDAKELARLQRMGSPADVWKAYRALEAKISSGQLKAAPKPDATPEELAAWRKDNGLPDSPEGYKPELPNGMVPGEAEMPLIGGFQKTAHELGMTPEQFNKTLSWYFAEQDAARQQAYDKEQQFRQQADDSLRQEWGPEYRANIRGITNALAPFFPGPLLDRIFTAQTETESVRYSLGNDPDILKGLNSLARTLNPMSTLVPAGSADPMKAGEARIAEIEAVMKTDNRAYWSNAEMQREYGQLLEARDAMKGRAA